MAPDLTLRVAPIQGFEPANVKIEMLITPLEGNNVACLVVDSESYYTSSCWELAGADDRTTHQRLLRDLPAGNYVVALNVERSGKVKSVTREFQVQSRSN